jgi:hypothetical protein
MRVILCVTIGVRDKTRGRSVQYLVLGKGRSVQCLSVLGNGRFLLHQLHFVIV